MATVHHESESMVYLPQPLGVCLGPFTLLAASTVSAATYVPVTLEAGAFRVVECDETGEILANAGLMEALREAETDVERGDLLDRSDLHRP